MPNNIANIVYTEIIRHGKLSLSSGAKVRAFRKELKKSDIIYSEKHFLPGQHPKYCDKYVVQFRY